MKHCDATDPRHPCSSGSCHATTHGRWALIYLMAGDQRVSAHGIAVWWNGVACWRRKARFNWPWA